MFDIEYNESAHENMKNVEQTFFIKSRKKQKKQTNPETVVLYTYIYQVPLFKFRLVRTLLYIAHLYLLVDNTSITHLEVLI